MANLSISENGQADGLKDEDADFFDSISGGMDGRCVWRHRGSDGWWAIALCLTGISNSLCIGMAVLRRAPATAACIQKGAWSVSACVRACVCACMQMPPCNVSSRRT